MIKIRFFSFDTHELCVEIYKRVSELNKDPLFGSKYCFVTTDDYTHAVIINTEMPDLKIPKENVVGIAFEPFVSINYGEFLKITPAFIEYAKKHIGTYFIGDNPNNILPDLFKEGYGYLWHVSPLYQIPIKNKLISLMISNKMDSEGHIYRHTLCKRILDSDLPIDIYGRGCDMYSNIKDSRIKGNFDYIEPYLNYTYHIAIENFIKPHYFSEKITNTLLCGTVPIYLGCKNIDNYFPGQVIHLSGDVDSDMNLLRNICENPEFNKKQINIDDVKKTISFTQLILKLGW